MGRVGSPPQARGRSQTVRRLNQFLARRRSSWHELTLADIGDELGLTRQAISILLPHWGRLRERARAQRVRRFAQRHPDARRSGSGLFMSWEKIGSELGLPGRAARRLWLAAGLSNDWRSSNEQLKESRARQQRVRHARVIRAETCEVCRRRFPWTVFRERERRLNGKRFVCSRSCAQRLRFRAPTAGR